MHLSMHAVEQMYITTSGVAQELAWGDELSGL